MAEVKWFHLHDLPSDAYLAVRRRINELQLQSDKSENW